MTGATPYQSPTSDLDIALQESEWAREDSAPLDAYALVLCTETDDYTVPRGRVLGGGRIVAFPGSAYGHVRAGCVYFVPTIDRHGAVTHCPFVFLAERGQREVRRYRKRHARRYVSLPPWARDAEEDWPTPSSG